jgi:hypothetical protein
MTEITETVFDKKKKEKKKKKENENEEVEGDIRVGWGKSNPYKK